MKTSGIEVPFAEAEAPLIKVALDWRGIPSDEAREPFTTGRWFEGDISKSRENGWIYFNLPVDEPSLDEYGDTDGHVDAQVWTGYNHLKLTREYPLPVRRTLEMDFPAGTISERQVCIQLYDRQIAACTGSFYGDHDPSLPARELFDAGVRWIVQHATNYINLQPA